MAKQWLSLSVVAGNEVNLFSGSPVAFLKDTFKFYRNQYIFGFHRGIQGPLAPPNFEPYVVYHDELVLIPD